MDTGALGSLCRTYDKLQEVIILALLKTVAEKLLERDYMLVPQLCDSTVIGKSSKYITFFKHIGPSLYGISFIASDTSYNCRMAYTILRNRFFTHAKSTGCGSAFFVGIFIDGGEEIEQFCTHDIEDYTSGEIEIRWMLDTSAKRITVKGSQPDRIADLHTIINSALAEESGALSYDTDIETLVNNERSKRLDAVKSRSTIFTLALIAINCFMLALTYLNGGPEISTLGSLGALDTEAVLKGGEYYRLFTSGFLHSGVLHLGCNMLFLYVFGSSIERYYGKLRLLIIYLGSMLSGNIIFMLFSGGVAVGASGAVFGLAAAVLAYSLHVKHSVDGKDTYFLLMFVLISIGAGFLDAGTANSAHLGGALFGFISGFLLCEDTQKK